MDIVWFFSNWYRELRKKTCGNFQFLYSRLYVPNYKRFLRVVRCYVYQGLRFLFRVLNFDEECTHKKKKPTSLMKLSRCLHRFVAMSTISLLLMLLLWQLTKLLSIFLIFLRSSLWFPFCCSLKGKCCFFAHLHGSLCSSWFRNN